MRHRRHTPTPTHTRTLRAAAGLPCAAALLIAALTGAAPAQDPHRDGERSAAVASEDRRAPAKSPDRHGTSHVQPSHGTTLVPGPYGTHEQGGAGDDGTLFGTHDRHEGDPDAPVAPEDGSVPSSDRHPPTTAATGEVSPVLPLGAGMTLIGLGLALTAFGLRRA